MSALLIIGDWSSKCGSCGEGADPVETTHRTALRADLVWPSPGCGVRWTHVSAAPDSRTGARGRIQEMRPDLVYVQTEGAVQS